jgi:hypothetical protein
MIVINECRVSNDNKKIYIDVETTEGYAITSIKLWNENTFKVFSQAKVIPVNSTTNQENIIVLSETLGFKKFDGIYFIEFETNAPNLECDSCPNPVTAVVTNLVSYYKCGMEMLLKASKSCMNIFSAEVCDSSEVNKVMSVHLLIDGINEAIKINRFIDAINLLVNLKKICNSCSDCNSSETGNNVDCTSCGSTSVYYS